MATASLPSFIHAIGGSLGSALAILAFYPLERIRVELQSQGYNERNSDNYEDHQDDNSTIDNNTGGSRRSKEIKQIPIQLEAADNLPINLYCTKNVIDSTVEHTLSLDEGLSLVTATPEQSASTPTSSNESYEFIVSPKTMDPEVLNGPCSEEDDSGFPTVDKNSYSDSSSKLQPLPTDIPDSRCRKVDDSQLSSSENDGTETDKIQQTIDIPIPTACANVLHESMVQCFLRLRKEQSLYQGVSHILTTFVISNFVFFYTLQVAKRGLFSIQTLQNQPCGRTKQSVRRFLEKLLSFLFFLAPKSKVGVSLLSSTLAGIINVCLTNPLWVASLRIMESKIPPPSDTSLGNTGGGQDCSHRTASLWTAMKDIAATEGISQLWNGTWTSLLLVSNPIIQHFLYEQLRSWQFVRRREQMSRNSKRGWRKHHGGDDHLSHGFASLTPMEAFFFGALAKTVATVVTYPLQLVQLLLRLQSKNGEKSILSNNKAKRVKERVVYDGTINCLCHLFAHGGIPALFHGMASKLVHTVLTSAFMFLTYEQILVFVRQVYEAVT